MREHQAHMPQGHRLLRGCSLHTYVLGQAGWKKKCCLCLAATWCCCRCCWAQFVLPWQEAGGAGGRVATNGNVGSATGQGPEKNKEWREKKSDYIPEHACGGSGNINVVELLRLATAQPSDCGLKLRSCCIKSEHSIRATSAKCRSHSIWFCRERERERRAGEQAATVIWAV